MELTITQQIIQNMVKYPPILFLDKNKDKSVIYLLLNTSRNIPVHVNKYIIDHTTSIGVIEYDCCSNMPISNISGYVTIIIFGTFFNEYIDNLPNSVRIINFGKYFNRQVDNLPNSVRSIEFGIYFNRSVSNLPSGIEIIIFGCGFNRSVDNLPNSIKTIVFNNNLYEKYENLPKFKLKLNLNLLSNKPINKLPKLITTCYTNCDNLLCFHSFNNLPSLNNFINLIINGEYCYACVRSNLITKNYKFNTTNKYYNRLLFANDAIFNIK